MDDNIIDKLLQNNENDGYENILSLNELISIKEYIESLKRENSIYKNLYKLTDGFIISNFNYNNEINFNDEINNITFNFEFKIIDNGVEIINFLSFVSLNGHYLKINFDYDKIKIEDNKNCLYIADYKLVKNRWYKMFGIFQISDQDINIILEIDDQKVNFNKGDSIKNNLLLDKKWNIFVDHNNIIEYNLIFKKFIIIQDKLSFEQIENFDYKNISNNIYIVSKY
jgi:hypothetical protein